MATRRGYLLGPLKNAVSTLGIWGGHLSVAPSFSPCPPITLYLGRPYFDPSVSESFHVALRRGGPTWAMMLTSLWVCDLRLPWLGLVCWQIKRNLLETKAHVLSFVFGIYPAALEKVTTTWPKIGGITMIWSCKVDILRLQNQGTNPNGLCGLVLGTSLETVLEGLLDLF